MLNLPELNIPIEEEFKKVLSADEVVYVMSKNNKANAVLSLQSKHLKRLKESGHIWEFSFLS